MKPSSFQLQTTSQSANKQVYIQWLRLLLLPLLFGFGLQAQNIDFDNYQLLKAQGAIPEDLRRSSSAKYEAERAKLENGGKGKEQAAQDQFLLQSNFILDEMLLSGRVLFNDPVGEYVTKVKNKLLEGSPDLQAKIKTYVVKSPVANAFATNSGILLVNMGLIARLQNEAELAFVLSHEIQHYLNQHPMNVYVKSEELKGNKKLYNLNSQEDFQMAKSKYSREVEQDADDLGFELYQKSGYSLEAAIGVFDVLRLASQPFDQIPWESSFFEWEFLRFPASYSRWPLDKFEKREDEPDSLSTHPNIAKRRTIIEAKVAAAGNDDGEVFLIGPMEFLNARKVCRFEMSELYYDQQAFEASFYNSYLLRSEEPESHFLEKSMAKCMYGMVKYRYGQQFSNYHLGTKNCQGERQQIQHFWESLLREELNTLAIRFCWKASKNAPNDADLKSIVDELLISLHQEKKDVANWLEKELPTQMPEIVSKTHDEKLLAFQMRGEAEKEEGEKELEEEGEEEEAATPEEDETDEDNDDIAYFQWALSDLFQDEAFADAWNRANDYKKPEKEATQTNLARNFSYSDVIKNRAIGPKIGANKVVFVQPIFKIVDTRKDVKMEYLASEASLNAHRDMLAEMAKRNNLQYSFLENRNLKEGAIDVFNDATLASKWFNEVVESNGSATAMISFNESEMAELAKKYGTPYFVWNGVISVTSAMDPNMKMIYLVTGCVVPVALPFIIYAVVKPEKRTYIVTYVLNAETGEIEMEEFRRLAVNKRPKVVKANLYDILHQIKAKP